MLTAACCRNWSRLLLRRLVFTLTANLTETRSFAPLCACPYCFEGLGDSVPRPNIRSPNGLLWRGDGEETLRKATTKPNETRTTRQWKTRQANMMRLHALYLLQAASSSSAASCSSSTGQCWQWATYETPNPPPPFSTPPYPPTSPLTTDPHFPLRNRSSSSSASP